MARTSQTASVGIEVTGDRALQRALRALGETEAPYLRDAMEVSGRRLASAVASRATGGIATATDFVGVRGKGGRLKAVVRVKHPGAKSMEFGRQYYYRGFQGRRMKATGSKFKANPGQPERPFVGIKRGDQAIGSVRDDIRAAIEAAMEREWLRITGAGD